MLYTEFDSYKKFVGKSVFTNKAIENKTINNNLNQRFLIREYQNEAIGRLLFYMEDYQNKVSPTHLLFNMATGSGKTLIMAASILYFYEKGYRNFIFFTRLDNIIQKTKDNFTNPLSNKYLFSEKITINGNLVNIKEVDNFDGTNDDDINIMFSTTSLLHHRLNAAKENSITFEDLENKKIVFLADEAHNLSAETTGKKTDTEKKEKKSWEETVKTMLRTNTERGNVLLEFTATARLEETYPEIMKKYEDKAIFKYDLKEFRLDGFSKNVKTVQVNAALPERVLTAVLISQYRRKVAEKNNLFIKPVIMFKANRVTPTSKTEDTVGLNPKVVVSGEFKEKFHDLINSLTASRIERISTIDDFTLNKAFEFFKENKISAEDLVAEIKNDFSEDRCLSVDDDSDVRDQQLLLNSLEDSDNQIRVIFATEKLNEGWDVLNLFDIVRLYDTRDAKSNVAGKTTVQEAQLIGRGARYCPFKTRENESIYIRKFDDDANNELSVLEYLYYHSASNPRYIQELESVLVKEGILASSKIQRELTIKDDFKESWFWKKGVIYLNSKEKNLGENVFNLLDAGISFDYRADWNIYKLPTRAAIETDIFTGKSVSNDKAVITRELNLLSLGPNVIRKALDRFPSMNFARIKTSLGNLNSVSELITSTDYLGSTKVLVSATEERLRNLSQDDKLRIAKFVISRIVSDIGAHSGEYRGSSLFKAYRVNERFYDKVLNLDEDSFRARTMQSFDFDSAEWFAQNETWGTSEEESFIRFMSGVVDELKKEYDDIALLRNEMFVKVHNFDDGLPFYPDFVLFLKKNGKKKTSTLQVFIEPKGDGFLDVNKRFENSQEGWKQRFLKDISENYDIDLKIENQDFKLIGLPFYNEGNLNQDLHNEFSATFEKELLEQKKP